MSVSSTRIYLVRHGISEWNLQKRWQGQTDTKLAPIGIEQAKARADKLKAQGVLFTAAYSSDLERASHTAAILASACGGCEVVADQRLRECSLGEFEGKTKSEIYGDGYTSLWQALKAMPHEQRIRTPYFQGLETPFDVGARAAACLVEACGRHDGGNVLAVTHSTVIESILATCFGAEFDAIATENLAVTILEPHHVGGVPGLRVVGTDGVGYHSCLDALYSDITACRLLGCSPGRPLYLASTSIASGNKTAAVFTHQKSGRAMVWASCVLAAGIGIAGVARIVAMEGTIGGKQLVGQADPQTYPAFWGPVTASVDWCERNYSRTPWVAEPWNAVSSLFIALLGTMAAAQVARVGGERRYVALGALLAVVGLGSAAYHSTLRKQDQALDEIPMLWIALQAAYCVLRCEELDPHQPSTSRTNKPRSHPLVGPILLVYGVLISYLQWSTAAQWQPVAFHFSFGTAELFFLAGTYQQYTKSVDPRNRLVMERGFLLYALAVCSWAVDNGFCQQLQTLPFGLPYPQVHAWGWHGLIALASYLLIVAGSAERLLVRGKRCCLRPSTFFGFFLPSIQATGGKPVGESGGDEVMK